MIFGGLVAVAGLISSVVGVIPGVLGCMVGVSIHQTGDYAKKFIDSKGKRVIELNNLIKYVGRSFFFVGTIVIIFVVSYGLLLMIE